MYIIINDLYVTGNCRDVSECIILSLSRVLMQYTAYNKYLMRPGNFAHFLLQYRCFPLSEVKMYW